MPECWKRVRLLRRPRPEPVVGRGIDHHGDGIVGITCKVLPGDNKVLVAADPRRFYMPAYVASKGWVGLRLDVGEVDWDEVNELITHSYVLVAPTRLATAPAPSSSRAPTGVG